jgi:pimeloyl-ACP methyl ester carboxylesterase
MDAPRGEPGLSGVAAATVDVGGQTVRVYDSGPLDPGRPLVLVHGTSGSAASSFSSLHPMLAMRRRVIALDLVDPVEGDATADHYVAQIAAVIAEVGFSGLVDVAGYSFGSVIVARLAARHPELVRRLVLIAGWAKSDAQQRLRNDIWSALSRENPVALGDFTVFTAHSAGYLNALPPADLDRMRATAQSTTDRAVKMRFNRTVDIVDDLEQIDAETLVIGCSEDQMVPVHHTRQLFGGIRNACYAEIVSGHGVVLERPAEVFMMVDDFLANPSPIVPGTVLERIHV